MPLANARHFRPRRLVPRSLSKETRTDVSWVESLLSESSKLNLMGRTFTRATSAWDPKYNCIQPPGVARQRPIRYLDRYTIMADLIEGPATNLLAAGTSDRFDLWSAITAQLVGGQVAPDGSLTAWNITDSSGVAFQSIQQTVTIPNNGLPYCFSLYVLKTSGGTSATFGVNYTLVGGTTLSGSPRFNTDTGGLLNGAAGMVVTSAGIYWRISMFLTNNTTGNVSANISIFPATAANGQAVDSAAATGTATIAWGQLEQAAFPSSYISNRNLSTKSHLLGTAPWTQSSATVTSGLSGDPSGGSNSNSMVEGAASNQHHTQNGVAVTNNATITFSCYAKAGARSILRMSHFDSSDHHCYFNLATGIPGSVGSGCVTSMVNAGGGWWRCIVTRTITGTTFFGIIGMVIADGAPVYTGDGVSNIFVTGAQFEYGSTASSLWGVNAAVGGRDLDALTVNFAARPGGNLPGAAGTIFGWVLPQGWTTSPSGVVARFCDDDNTTNSTSLQISAAGAPVVRKVDSTTAIISASPPAAIFTNNVLGNIAMSWSSTAVTGYTNGVAGTPVTGFTAPLNATTNLEIGTGTARTQPCYSYVAFIYGPRVWTALEHSLIGTAQMAAP